MFVKFVYLTILIFGTWKKDFSYQEIDRRVFSFTIETTAS